MSDLPDYHCPDCDAIDCLHCFCLEDCEPCQEFIQKDNETVVVLTKDDAEQLAKAIEEIE